MMYPIFVYIASSYLNIKNLPLLPYHYKIQVYYSSPFLLVAGIIIISLSKKYKIGLVFISIGIFWLSTIICEIFTK